MSLDYLSKYGNSFQLKIIANLLKSNNKINDNVDFLPEVIDMLTPDYFESDANQYIIGVIIDYYKKYQKPPTAEVFKVEISTVDDILRESIIINIKEIYKYIEGAEDLDYVRDKFFEFCENQNMKKAILKSVEYLETGNYDGIKKTIDDARKIGSSKDIGHVYEDMIDDRVIKNPRKNVISTEWSVINEITDGGIGAGDLLVLVGSAGSGKCVGPNTKINIKYDEIGIKDEHDNIIWYKPWDEIVINGKKYLAYELSGEQE